MSDTETGTWREHFPRGVLDPSGPRSNRTERRESMNLTGAQEAPADVMDEIARLRAGAKMLGRIVVKQARTFEAARIEMHQNGPESAMQWILNSIPDVSDETPEDQWDGKETATHWLDRVEAADRAAEAGAAR